MWPLLIEAGQMPDREYMYSAAKSKFFGLAGKALFSSEIHCPCQNIADISQFPSLLHHHSKIFVCVDRGTHSDVIIHPIISTDLEKYKKNITFLLSPN